MELALLIDDLEQHIALVLVEELFGGLVVIVGSGVGSTNDHDGIVFGAEKTKVAYRWLQEVLVLGQPLWKVEREWKRHVVRAAD